MKSSFFLVFLLLASVSFAKAQEALIFKKFAGTYITGHDFGGGSITLREDGTFSDGAGSDDGTSVASSGTYTLKNGLLIFSIKAKSASRGDGQPIDLLDNKETGESTNGATPHDNNREFALLPVEWSGRMYLIYESEMKSFVNSVNLGIEPRETLQSHSDVSPWLGSFYLRKGDQKKRVRGRPSLPKQWQVLLLERPLFATVIKVESVKHETYGIVSTVTINKEARDGLGAGIQLITRGEIPSLAGGTFVISVTKNQVKLKAVLNRAIKIGDRVSSRFEPSPALKRYWMFQDQNRSN